MKIAFNARTLAAPSFRGWSRYTFEILRELGSLGVKLILYTDRELDADRLAGLPSGSFDLHVAPKMGYFAWEQRWLPARCEEHGADLLHCPVNFGLPARGDFPKVLTLHDAIDSVYYGWGYGHGWLGLLHPSTLSARFHHRVARRNADRIIAPSAHARRDFIEALRVPAAKITVIPEAAGRRFHEPVAPAARESVRRAHGLSRPYVLNIGGWDPRKNVPFLIEAFFAANPDGVDLALAGEGTPAEEKAVTETVSRLGLQERVRLLGPVDDGELPALYAEALCYVHPSLYEGFGLQLCEAMATGCPVLAAAATCTPEVLGDGGVLFGAQAPSELGALLARVASDPTFRAELSALARRRGSLYSWRKTAEATLEVYREILSASRNR